MVTSFIRCRLVVGLIIAVHFGFAIDLGIARLASAPQLLCALRGPIIDEGVVGRRQRRGAYRLLGEPAEVGQYERQRLVLTLTVGVIEQTDDRGVLPSDAPLRQRGDVADTAFYKDALLESRLEAMLKTIDVRRRLAS